MLKYRVLLVVCTVALALTASNACADTWRLTDGNDLTAVSGQGSEKFLLAVTNTKQLVNTGQLSAAKEAYKKLEGDFPEIAGPDFDAFVKAEMFFCEGKFTRAIRAYDKFLKDYPMSKLYDAAIDREFAVATAYLGGERKTVLKVIKLKGYAEGIKIMEKVTDLAGYYSPIGIKAAIAVAEHYEKHHKYDDAYLKWHDISTHWMVGEIGMQALHGMARSQYTAYNDNPEERKPFFDGSRLSIAKTQYEKLQLLFPKDAEEIGVADILNRINEQMAYKQYSTACYYERVGKPQAATLYYDMVVRNWPDTKAAELAKEKHTGSLTTTERDK